MSGTVLVKHLSTQLAAHFIFIFVVMFITLNSSYL